MVTLQHENIRNLSTQRPHLTPFKGLRSAPELKPLSNLEMLKKGLIRG